MHRKPAVQAGVVRGRVCACAAALAVGVTTAGARAYVASGNWPSDGSGHYVISYSYSNLLDGGLSGVTPDELTAAVQEAFLLWSAVAPIEMTQQIDSGPAAGDTFYGPGSHPKVRLGHHDIAESGGNTLAHAYIPTAILRAFSGLAGDVHFDDSDTWDTQPGPGVFDILDTATHEIGHALGLDHEDDVPSIMATFYDGIYSGLTTGFLYQDDINGIQSIYGAGLGYVLGFDNVLRFGGTNGDNTFTLSHVGTLLTASSAGIGSIDRGIDGVGTIMVDGRLGNDRTILSEVPADKTVHSFRSDIWIADGNTLSITETLILEQADMRIGTNDTAGTVNLSDGLLDLRGGDVVAGPSGVFNFTGGVLRDVDDFGLDLDQQGGTLQIGNSPGAMTIDGDYDIASPATLEIELAPGSQFDTLDVTGDATLGGTLDLLLIDGFTPTFGDMFTFLTADDITGSFDTILGDVIDPALRFDLAATSTALTLEVVARLPADFDLDGDIDLDDYDIMSGNMYGNGLDYTDGDATGDGLVNFEDFVVMALNFGAVTSETLGQLGDPIPEPALASLLLAGCVLTCRGGRQNTLGVGKKRR